MSAFYRWIYKTFHRPLIALYRIEIQGGENIPEGGCILASNHTSLTDVLVLSASVGGRQIRYMAKSELFRIPLFSKLIRALGAYPVNRGGTDVRSIKTAVRLVEDGEMLGIFPQGTRRGGVDPRTTDVKGGVGLIAYQTKADVLPVFIDNKSRKTKMFHRNRVIFGPVISYGELGLNAGGMSEYRSAAQYIFGRICELGFGTETDGGAESPDAENRSGEAGAKDAPGGES